MQVSQSDCQCFGSLGLRLYAQEVSLDAGLPMLIAIITLECQKIVFRGGGFRSHASLSTVKAKESFVQRFAEPLKNASYPTSIVFKGLRKSRVEEELSIKD